mgnify:FL=1
MTLDIEELTKYSGQGKCDQIRIWDCFANFREQLLAWAQSKDWVVVENSNLCLDLVDSGNFM